MNVTFVGDSPSGSCPKQITRTYQGLDACQNVGTCTQLITVHDTTPPSLTCPDPVTVQCDSEVPPPDPSSVQTSDNCAGQVTVIHLGDSPSGSCPTQITRTYQGTDACQNVATCTQLITVHDTTPPSLTCPDATTVQCDADVPAPDPATVIATDNCGGQVTVIHLSDESSGSCPRTITRTYQGTDACQNVATCTQVITVHDTTPPSLTCPQGVTVECDVNIPPPDITAVQATDNCGGAVTISHVGDVPVGTCPTIITRTYQGIDDCQNVGTCTQIITVHDTTPPVITCPPDFTLPCGTSTAPTVTGFATATDNCVAFPPVTFTDLPTGQCPDASTIVRTWSTTDGCNTVTCQQTITLTQGPGSGCTPGSVVNLGGDAELPAPFLTSTMPTIGQYLSFHITNAPPNGQIIFLAQGQPFPAPLNIVDGCVLWVDPAVSMSVDFWFTDSNGDWVSRILLAQIPELLNMVLRIQAGVIAPGGPLALCS